MLNRIPVGRAGTALAFTVMVASTSAAQAPTRPAQPVPVVEVVATRIPEAPHDVAASIEVITGANLRARGATTLRDALSLAAGVAIAPGGDAGPASSVAEFWGLREFDAFLLVVDGIPWGGAFNPAVSSLSLQDVERIEVLRGPAPVTYGATSFVGVIHVVHSAAAESRKSISAHGGNFGTVGGALDYALSPTGNWRARLSADGDRVGFQDDRTNYSRGHGLLRMSNTEAANKPWASLDISMVNQSPASPHPREGASLSTNTPLDANYNPKNAEVNETRVAASAGLERPVLDGARWASTASLTHSEQNQFRGFLTNIANSTNNAAGYTEDIEIIDLYGDTHIIWPTISDVRIMVGADALFANGEAKGATFNYTVPLSGTTATTVPKPTLLDKDAEARRMFLGVYGSAEWRPATELTLSAGLRVNSTTESRGEGASVSHNRLSGSVGALYSLWEKGTDHVKVFANYRDTFKPAAFDFSLAENEGVLEPETSRSYEGGVKTRFMDGVLDVEASVFRMDFSNLVTPTIVNNLPALINSGTTKFQGFELATDFRVMDDLSARATYSFHDGKFVNFIQEFGGVPTQLGGKRFEMSARQMASGGLLWAPELGVVAHVSANYTGDRYLNKRNTALAAAFTTFDAGVGYRMRDFEFRVDGRNLGDRRDAISESEFGDAQYYRMPARSIQAGVSLRY